MKFDDFRLRIVLRVLLLLFNLLVLVWGLLHTDWQMTPVVCALILFLQTGELVHYVETSNRQLSSFLSAIMQHDFSSRFSAQGKGESFRELASAFNLINREFIRLNSERAAKHQLLEALIEHISVALICIDQRGQIILMNNSAMQLFRFPYIQNAHALSKVNPELPKIVSAAPIQESQMVRLSIAGEELPLSMYTSKFTLLDESYTLVSFQNIRDELEMRELDSWQKLIRVLTHEIMNSVTPIVSLTAVIKQVMVDAGENVRHTPLTEEEADDLVRSLKAIEARGKGLLRFVESYNNLANPPKPFFTQVEVAGLLDRVCMLMLPELETCGIALHTRCVPENLSLQADSQQIEQVLINLIKNAREAMSVQGDRIRVSALKLPNGSVQITVNDNGPGIDAGVLQDIFIPFYTSKKQGSGIGLSISRQLMLANRGQLTVSSEPGRGSEFTLLFRPSASN